MAFRLLSAAAVAVAIASTTVEAQCINKSCQTVDIENIDAKRSVSIDINSEESSEPHPRPCNPLDDLLWKLITDLKKNIIKFTEDLEAILPIPPKLPPLDLITQGLPGFPPIFGHGGPMGSGNAHTNWNGAGIFENLPDLGLGDLDLPTPPKLPNLGFPELPTIGGGGAPFGEIGRRGLSKIGSEL